MTAQLSGDRGGATFDRTLDGLRLDKQMERVYRAMSDGQWHTLAHLAWITEAPEASVSARLRDLRKERFGGYSIEAQRVGPGGTHVYRMQ